MSDEIPDLFGSDEHETEETVKTTTEARKAQLSSKSETKKRFSALFKMAQEKHGHRRPLRTLRPSASSFIRTSEATDAAPAPAPVKKRQRAAQTQRINPDDTVERVVVSAWKNKKKARPRRTTPDRDASSSFDKLGQCISTWDKVKAGRGSIQGQHDQVTEAAAAMGEHFFVVRDALRSAMGSACALSASNSAIIARPGRSRTNCRGT